MTTPEVLRLDSVDFVRQSRAILADIDLTVHAGERWALIGPNGAGKSTILSLCGAEQHPTRGTVHVLGHQLGRVETRKLRESIGHVNPRHPLRSPLSIREVVLTGATGTTELMDHRDPAPETLARADELIEMLGLSALASAPWTNLSQGERGRTLIARALLSDPRLLLLDEPSTGLDVAARERLLQTVDRLHRTHPDLATVLVTHHLEELPETTTHAVLVTGGRILAAGPVHDILTTALVTECFDYPIEIAHQEGRWSARGVATTSP